MSKNIYLAGGFYGPSFTIEVKEIKFNPNEPMKTYSKKKVVDWQTYVTHRVSWEHKTIFNPKKKFAGYTGSPEEDMVFSKPRNYTSWDMQKIKESDVVFAYIDSENPGVGVIAELGYAKGLGKFVILVVETPHKVHKDHHFNFIREMSDVYFSSIEEGVLFLKSL